MGVLGSPPTRRALRCFHRVGRPVGCFTTRPRRERLRLPRTCLAGAKAEEKNNEDFRERKSRSYLVSSHNKGFLGGTWGKKCRGGGLYYWCSGAVFWRVFRPRRQQIFPFVSRWLFFWQQQNYFLNKNILRRAGRATSQMKIIVL